MNQQITKRFFSPALSATSQLGQRRWALQFMVLLPIVVLASGCVNALRVASPPTTIKLRVLVARPEQHSVQVRVGEPATYPVAADGRVEFTVPSFHHGCDIYLLGLIKIRDGSAEGVRIVELRREQQTIRKLSLTDIAKLARDETGYSVFRVGK